MWGPTAAWGHVDTGKGCSRQRDIMVLIFSNIRGVIPGTRLLVIILRAVVRSFIHAWVPATGRPESKALFGSWKWLWMPAPCRARQAVWRSEERRVGKECRSRV